MNKREVGKDKEGLAALYLEKEGCHILERNFRTRYGEIDLIARDGKEYVFVEVKYRSGTGAGDPAEAVGEKKQEVIRRTALSYLKKNGINPAEAYLRFDVISILGSDLRHYPNAF